MSITLLIIVRNVNDEHQTYQITTTHHWTGLVSIDVVRLTVLPTAKRKMKSRTIHGHTAVCGLFGDGWVYLRASKTGLHLLGLQSWVDESAVRSAVQDDDCAVRVGTGVAHAEIGVEAAAAALKAPGRHLVPVPIPQSNKLEEWRAAYAAARDEKAVRAWADAAMKTYEDRERKREQARRKLREGAPDDDGFVTVVGGPSVESAAAAVAHKRKAGVEPEGFYRWQKRQKLDVDGLRERFAQVKKRVAAAARLDMPKPDPGAE